METYIAKGIVLKENDIGESNKLLRVFTDKDGLIVLNARGAKKSSSKNFAGSQLFCYSEMNIFRGGNFNRLNNATPIDSFYGLTTDLDALENAGKIANLTLKVIQEDQPDVETLRLLLNTFYFLSNKKNDPLLLRSIFNIRFLCIQGFYPEDDTLLRLACSGVNEEIGENVYRAAKFICEGEDNSLFGIKVSENVNKKLSQVGEKLAEMYIY